MRRNVSKLTGPTVTKATSGVESPDPSSGNRPKVGNQPAFQRTAKATAICHGINGRRHQTLPNQLLCTLGNLRRGGHPMADVTSDIRQWNVVKP
jgi:hypothetical protein